MAESAAPLIHSSRIVNRWAQLIAGIIAMMAIANLQYAWTLFTKPMQSHLHVTLTAIQGIFSLFILLETWLVPFEGYLVDRIGPRLMLGVGGILVGLGWVFSGQAETLRGHRLRRNHRQRAEMVSRSPRALRRTDGWRVRHWNGVDGGSH
jgi:OFA family oxalate/formate antiporter-like MFS transporter